MGYANINIIPSLSHQGHLFSFLDLQVQTRGGEVVSTSVDMLGTWEHSGAVTDIAVADLASSGEMLLAVASSKGSVCLARLLLPRLPGTSPEDIQVRYIQVLAELRGSLCLFGAQKMHIPSMP